MRGVGRSRGKLNSDRCFIMTGSQLWNPQPGADTPPAHRRDDEHPTRTASGSKFFFCISNNAAATAGVDISPRG